MPDLTKEELWKQLKAGFIAPVYVLFGDEAYLRDRAAAEIVRRSFGENDLRDFNYDEFSLDGRESIGFALAAADQLPMMSERRVVKVSRIRVAAASQRDTLCEDDHDVLARYLAEPCSSTVLILVADELNGNRKITRLLKKDTANVEFGKLDDHDLFDWISRAARDLGAEIGNVASRRLVDLVGPNIQRLNNEIEKLSAAALPSAAITVEMVDELVGATRELENFALTDALVSGRGHDALSVMKRILDGGGEPVALIGLLAYNIRRLLMAKEMMAHGDDHRQVAGILKMRYRDQEDFLAAARRADRATLVQLFDKLKAADLAVKTSIGGGGNRGARMQLQMLVCEIVTAMRRN